MNILIKDARVLLYNENKFYIKETSILIENDRISKIGDIDCDGCQIIDGKHKLVMPGLINTHGHLAMSLFRNYKDDVDLDTWLHKYIFPKEDELKDGDCYYPVLLSTIEMIRAGITNTADMYFFMEDAVRAVAESGIKANLSRSVSCFGEFTRSTDYRLKEMISLYEKYNGSFDGRIKVSFAPHSIYTCTPEYIRECGEIAREYNADLQIHMCETLKEVNDCKEKYGITPFELCESLSLFNNNNTIAAHCVHLSDVDYEIIKKHNITISHNPTSNLKLASGVADIPKALELGINVSLGTDGAGSNNAQNLFNEMRLCGILHKGIKLNPEVVPANEVLKMATINGAKAFNDKETGIIEEGKKADLIILDIDKPHYYPLDNERMINSLIYSSNSSDVETVIIDGKVIMKNKELLTIDEEKVKYHLGGF